MVESDTFIIHYDTNYDLDDYSIDQYGDTYRKEQIEETLHHKIKTDGGEVMSKEFFYEEFIEPVKEDMRSDTEERLESLTGLDISVNEIKIEHIESV